MDHQSQDPQMDPRTCHLDPDYVLEVRQQPAYARVAIGKEKGK
jgi:hypothetical protein